jgi:hypothetical protein
VRSGSAEVNGNVSGGLPTGQFIRAEAKSGCGEIPDIFALCP